MDRMPMKAMSLGCRASLVALHMALLSLRLVTVTFEDKYITVTAHITHIYHVFGST